MRRRLLNIASVVCLVLCVALMGMWARSYASLSYSSLVLTSSGAAFLFQLRLPLQFGLRTLFMATTFLAVVLGMIAWLDRAWIGK